MKNLISQAVEQVGLVALASECKVTYQAVRRWEKNERLPRTEWTGETNYAAIIERMTNGDITRDALMEWSARGLAA